MRRIDTDVAILGAGTAGLAAYRAAKAAGKRALLVEPGPYGTTCARVGCMPSKLLIAAAEAAHGPVRWNELGLESGGPVRVDGPRVMARVRREANALGIPIMADESVLDHASLIRIVKADAADIVKVKVMKQGGVLNTRRMIATAEAAGIRCVVGHGFGLGPHTMAEIMVAATSNNVLDGLECVGPLKTRDDVVTEKLDLSTGSLALPGGPGLGVTLDDAKLARYRPDS